MIALSNEGTTPLPNGLTSLMAPKREHLFKKGSGVAFPESSEPC